MDYGQMEAFINQSTHCEIALSPLYQLISTWIPPFLQIFPPTVLAWLVFRAHRTASRRTRRLRWGLERQDVREEQLGDLRVCSAPGPGAPRWVGQGVVTQPEVWEKQQVLMETSPPPGFSELVSIVMHLYSTWLTFNPSFQNASFLVSQLT